MTVQIRPDFVPAGAQQMPFSELAARHDAIKPKSRSRVRASFECLRFTPRGEIKAITAAGMTILQGRIHAKTYAFDGTDQRLGAGTLCWVWTLDDERAEQETPEAIAA